MALFSRGRRKNAAAGHDDETTTDEVYDERHER